MMRIEKYTYTYTGLYASIMTYSVLDHPSVVRD